MSGVSHAGDVTATMVEFARGLRAAGVQASLDRVHAMVRALGALDVLRREDVYWAGRFTLCGNREDVRRYDLAFSAYFAGEQAPPARRATPVQVMRPVALPGRSDPGGASDESPDVSAAATASEVEVLRYRDYAGLTEAEREQTRRLLAALAPPGPQRPSRRFRPSTRGPVDAHRTVRAMLRRGGEAAELARHAHRRRLRRIVLLVDVSGSMAAYADAMLRFAHAVTRRRQGTEVFTVGTRLTRVTREMAERDVEGALAAVSGAVPDWSGGTRLGDLLKEFLDRWGQRGMARGAVVVVFSDGWERGDATLLGDQAARLHRHAHRVVWANPHKAQPGYEPLTAGMAAALPHVDDFVEGHSLAAFECLAGMLSTGDTRRADMRMAGVRAHEAFGAAAGARAGRLPTSHGVRTSG